MCPIVTITPARPGPPGPAQYFDIPGYTTRCLLARTPEGSAAGPDEGTASTNYTGFIINPVTRLAKYTPID